MNGASYYDIGSWSCLQIEIFVYVYTDVPSYKGTAILKNIV